MTSKLTRTPVTLHTGVHKVEKRILGRTALAVSRAVLGMMAFGMPADADPSKVGSMRTNTWRSSSAVTVRQAFTKDTPKFAEKAQLQPLVGKYYPSKTSPRARSVGNQASLSVILQPRLAVTPAGSVAALCVGESFDSVGPSHSVHRFKHCECFRQLSNMTMGFSFAIASLYFRP